MERKRYLYGLLFMFLILTAGQLCLAYDEHYHAERKKIEENPVLSDSEKRAALDNLERSWRKSEQNASGDVTGGPVGSTRPTIRSTAGNLWRSDTFKVFALGIFVGVFVVIIKWTIDAVRRRRRAREGYRDYSGKE